MILTVTMNPSVDIAYQLNAFQLDTTNRTDKVLKTAGGKGLNVSRVLHQLNAKTLATGFIGGALGDFIEKQLDDDGIKHAFYRTTKETRNCIAVLHDNQQTEILEAGPTFSTDEEQAFLNHFTTLLPQASLVVISGSLPKGLSLTFYSQLIKLAKENNKKVLLDTSGAALLESLKNANAKPFLIKPNQEEISTLLNKEVATNFDELKADLTDPLFDGIEWIVVSLGADGAFVKHNSTYYRVTIPKITVVNPVGSGDSTVAGLAHGLNNNLSVEDLLKTAMTTGILNTMEERTGFINIEHFDQYYNNVNVTPLNN